jgi:hypothetical protein
MSDVVPWLYEQYQSDPEKPISKREIAEVFNQRQPKVMTVTRDGYFAFPNIPMDELIDPTGEVSFQPVDDGSDIVRFPGALDLITVENAGGRLHLKTVTGIGEDGLKELRIDEIRTEVEPGSVSYEMALESAVRWAEDNGYVRVVLPDNDVFSNAVKRIPHKQKGNIINIDFPRMSLRTPPGNEREMEIINKKIAKSQSQLTVVDRVSNWLSEMRDGIATGDLLWGMKQGFLDDTASVQRWEKEIFGQIQDAAISPWKMLHMTKNLPSVMAAIAKSGIPGYIDGAFQPVDGRKGFIDILRPLYEHPDGDLLELWQGYAAARRASELITQENRDGTSREKLFEQGEIDRLLALAQKYPVFEDVFSDWKQFNNDLLDLAVEKGVLSERERDAWADNDYVPFFRAMEGVEGIGDPAGFRGTRIKTGVEGQHHGIKRLHGSEKPLSNVIENMWFNTASLIDKVYKNEAMTRVVDMLEGIAMKEIQMPWEAIRITNDQLARALVKANLITEDPNDPDAPLRQVQKMTPEQRMGWNHVFRRVRPTGDNVVGVMREGKLKYYEVEDPHLLDTLKGMQAEGLAGFMKAMGFSKSLLTRMVTIEPGFMLANWMRDTLSAWVTSGANFVPVLDSVKAMKNIWSEDDVFMKAMMSGAGGGGFYDITAGEVRAALDQNLQRGGRHVLKKAWRGYMKLGAMSENSNRLATRASGS